MVVVASLVDKVPNQAGLSRTCEVLGASRLVLPSLSGLRDPSFSDISVTAHHHVAIEAVPPSDLVPWLLRMRAAGYALIGLEQTARSRPLPGFAFPPRTALVLGHERHGIPPPVLDTLDACVEIPQVGLVRSLNVHVSGAVALYECVRGRRATEAGGGASGGGEGK